MEDDNSDLFNVEPSKTVQLREMHFFNQETEIIKDGQRHRVVFGKMEEEKKSLHQIVSPYLTQFATTTAEFAAKAGSTTYEALKVGFLWVYNKLVNNVIPYAVQNLPKIVFLTKKEEKNENPPSASFEISVNEEDYNQIQKQAKKQGKTRVVVPLGTENDKHFEEYLRNEKYEIQDYSFPIDVESEQVRMKQSFLIPSESFQVICQGVKQSHLQLQMQQTVHKKIAYKLDKCFIFELQGQNTIEYDMLDGIQKSKDAKSGYIIAPEQTLRRSISDHENDPIAQLVSGKQAKLEWKQEKEVDMTRNVHVQITNRKPKPEYELALN